MDNKSVVRIDSVEVYTFFHAQDTIDIINDSVSTEPPKIYLNGLDCSIWQNNITWEKIDSIYSFIFIKATQSLRIDANFYSNWNDCDLIKGAYHFFNPNVNGEIQAKHFLSVVKLEKGNLPPVIDVEYYYYYWKNCNRYVAARNLRLMLEYIENTTCVKPIIYTNCSFWNKNLAKYVIFDPSKYPLWAANYYTESPCLPTGWTTWTFWQYSAKGKINGHYTHWGCNYFNGDNLDDILIK